ncbi:S46 family peptidase [Luteolibacter pohnpeiensis]|uniref:Dipeptidyl-peptidase n=1 Tax=Luteolibacter pohnpeiensis TaxID=454153 RepID=A0A934VV69_9BACT|nr:S46 family peptidase [Luteolibacter pohnpeiensis]MBK1881483.1 S46 family peptidase [Luteolibacter pohnpeiensis]
MTAQSIRLTSLLFVSILTAKADEGMWLFNKPPVRQVKEKYGFEMTPEWLSHLQHAAVRFNNGGSGSFVSDEGLILTNHHVGSGFLEKLSTAERDLLKDGFYADSLEAELPCPGLELYVLQGIRDVTQQVDAAVKGLSGEKAVAARRAVIAEIEKNATDQPDEKGDVVTLYRGGSYQLYLYKSYTDVRLVMAPDAQAGAFGGDPDNFEFPRYCLDYSFFRAYENGKPAKTPDFLKWNSNGPKEGELTFVAGHPGSTNRSVTLAELEDMRDRSMPDRLALMLRSEAILRAWADRDLENARRAKGSIVGTQNGRKAYMARLNGLLDPAFMQRKQASEDAFRKQLKADDQWAKADAAFDQIAKATAGEEALSPRIQMLEGGFGTGLYGMAKTLLRVADESEKPDGERLGEYQDASRVSLELGLLSDRPFYKNLETVRMADALMVLCDKLGATDPIVVKILAGKSPQERAAELVSQTQMDDVEVRRALYQGGKNAVDASNDPMIELARLVDPEGRELRAKAEEFSEATAEAHQEIAEARFAIEGDSNYPDATFSLRLSFGVAKGYTEDGVAIPYETTFSGMSARSVNQGGVAPFDFSPKWSASMAQLNPETPVDYVTTNDITGGNSGSPVVNEKAELIGLVFDSNSHGLVSDFAYTEERGRTVCVHPASIVESLEKIYHAKRVLDEILK